MQERTAFERVLRSQQSPLLYAGLSAPVRNKMSLLRQIRGRGSGNGHGKDIPPPVHRLFEVSVSISVRRCDTIIYARARLCSLIMISVPRALEQGEGRISSVPY